MSSVYPGFRELEIGQALTGRLTVTESHVVLASGIFADFAPLHVDEEYAKSTSFGTRIAHGTLITGIMAGVLSKALGTNAIGFLEQNSRFTAPVVPGDTVATVWTIIEKLEKPRLDGGIVKLDGVCTTQTGTVVVTSVAAMLVSCGDPVS